VLVHRRDCVGDALQDYAERKMRAIQARSAHGSFFRADVTKGPEGYRLRQNAERACGFAPAASPNAAAVERRPLPYSAMA
jgi:hypothetical protein